MSRINMFGSPEYERSSDSIVEEAPLSYNLKRMSQGMGYNEVTSFQTAKKQVKYSTDYFPMEHTPQKASYLTPALAKKMKEKQNQLCCAPKKVQPENDNRYNKRELEAVKRVLDFSEVCEENITSEPTNTNNNFMKSLFNDISFPETRFQAKETYKNGGSLSASKHTLNFSDQRY